MGGKGRTARALIPFAGIFRNSLRRPAGGDARCTNGITLNLRVDAYGTEMKARTCLVTGLSLIVLATDWRFGIAPRWVQRTPPGWTWQSPLLGTTGWVDPSTGQFLAQASFNSYIHTIRIVAETDRPREVDQVKELAINRPGLKHGEIL